MPDTSEELLAQISGARPSNEAEVETKILLPLFRLLGYSDDDRADKPSISMYFGHQKKTKTPDFILYDGRERAFSNALVAVEAKAPGIRLEDSVNQVVSYATWVGSPLLLMCNSEKIMISRMSGSSGRPEWIQIRINEIRDNLPQIQSRIGKSASVLFKEKIAYLYELLDRADEELPPEMFLLEYVQKFKQRFQMFALTSLLEPSRGDKTPTPEIPVNIKLAHNSKKMETSVAAVANHLLEARKRIFISGKPGSGKSTFSRRLAFALVTEQPPQGVHILPVFINLALGVPASRANAFSRSCHEMGVHYYPSLFRNVLNESHVILILDGVDEVREDPAHLLRSLFADCTDASIIITGRPHILESLSDALSSNNFQFGEILDLQEDEVWQVLARYIREREKYESVRKSVEEGRMPMMASPLLVLMLARVVNEMPHWESLCLMDLYEKYINVLHAYFNAPSVRGSSLGQSELVDDKIILTVHAKAASLAVAEPMLSFNSLRQKLMDDHGEDAAVCWTNCGLATSRQGRIQFVHESFLDYGIAYGLLFGLRTRGIDALGDSVINQAAYDLVGPSLTASDEVVIFQGIKDDNNRIRRRSAKLLEYRASDETVNYIEQEIFNEKSRKVFHRMVVLLLNHRPSALEEIWARPEQLHKRLKIRLARLMRERSSPAAYRYVLEMATLGSFNFVRAAFGIAARRLDFSVLDQLVSFYAQLKDGARGMICSELLLAPVGYREVIAPRLFRVEHGLSRKLRLVEMAVREGGVGVLVSNSDMIKDLREQIRSEPVLGRTTVDRLRAVLGQIIDSAESTEGPIVELADAISDRLRVERSG